MKPLDALKIVAGSLFVHAMVVACGGGDTATLAGAGGATSTGAAGGSPDTADGSRLRARHYVGSDGSRAPTGTWFDAQTQAECAFVQSADFTLRCVPVDLSGADLIFTDAACTNSLLFYATVSLAACDALGQPAAESRAFARVGGESAPSCLPYQLFRVGKQIPVPAKVWEKPQEGGPCAPAGLGSGTAFELGQELLASDLVSATID